VGCAYLTLPLGRSLALNRCDTGLTLRGRLLVPWVVRDISWKKFNNDTLRTGLNELIGERNRIAHGMRVTVRLQTLNRWKNMVEMFGPHLEAKVVDHVAATTGHRPAW
jgi:hypothetical protein